MLAKGSPERGDPHPSRAALTQGAPHQTQIFRVPPLCVTVCFGVRTVTPARSKVVSGARLARSPLSLPIGGTGTRDPPGAHRISGGICRRN